MTKTPKLRFPGFTDAWEQRKVGNFLTESKILGSRGNIARKLTVKLWNKGVVPKHETYNGSSATQYYIRKSGQFMYGKLDFLNQAFGIVPEELDGYESTLDSPAFDFSKEIDKKYFLEFVSRKEFYQYQGNIANGSRKAKRIHSETFFEMPITLPTLPEQKAIGTFFRQLDELLTLHQRKLDEVKNLKKSLLQKMFPKNGERIPEVRFPEFIDAWEQRKVGNFLTESKILGSRGNIARKLTVKLWNKGVVPKHETYNGSSATQYYIRKSGQFMYGKLDFLNQAFGIVPEELDGYESTLDSPAFDFSKEIDKKYFLEFVSRKEFYQYQGNIANGSRKAKRIHSETFFEMPITLPTLPEQKAIGTFFRQLDELLTLHQRKLEHLQSLKKALLQQMFV
ncbi:restriction endonuclease subunit S [Streptococcus mutans]|nr:restriction endonuclease subunit S [Streptococcus mutans]